MTSNTGDSPTARTPVVVEITRHGRTARLAVFDPGEYIQSHFARQEFYEEDLLSHLHDLLAPDDLVLDVGANIGNHAIYFGAICGCRVLAIEPFLDNFRHLQYNVLLNDLGERVRVMQVAAAEVSGRFARIASQDAANSGSVTMELCDEDTGIPSLRLDALDLPGPPRLVKIDTEGMDLAVLQGASELLSKHDPILVVEAGTVAQYDAIAAFLRQFSYICCEARNPTPTFVFQKRRAPARSAAPAYQLATTFAHQRIALSTEIDRLNRRVREVQQVYERSRTTRAELEQSRRELYDRVQRQAAEAAAGQKALEALKVTLGRREDDNTRLLRVVEADRQQLSEARAQEEKLRSRLEEQTREGAGVKAALDTQTRQGAELKAALDTQTRQGAELKAALEKRTQEKVSVEAAIRRREAELADSLARARKLGADLARISAEKERTAKSYRSAAAELEKMRSSASYRIGHAIVRAVKHPGKSTLLLPLSLIKIVFGRRRARPTKQAPPAQPKPPPPSAAPPPQARREPGREALVVAPRARAPVEVTDLSQLRLACIMDGFTQQSYAPECQVLQLTPDRWREEISGFRPHLLFVESAWRGKDGLWTRKISHPSRELLDLVAWCKERGVPTAFWNKEDPVHFQTFIGTARLFDYVFTTDIDCISQYRTLLDSQQVHLLLFACQPKLHNPLEICDRRNAFCFAGAYYVRYPERIVDLETFVTMLSGMGPLEIYDRNYYESDPDYMFPEAYKPFIVGHLPTDQIDRAYKGYRYGINLNSIKYSQTMFARRVCELLASNTVTVSNYSRGLRLLFGDLVISTDNGPRLREEIERVSGDEIYFRKLRLAGLRKVLSEHTYRDRLAHVAEKALGIPRRSTLPRIAVIALVGDDEELSGVLPAFRRQRYPYKSLVLVLREGYLPTSPPSDPEVSLFTWAAAESQPMPEVVGSGFAAGFVAGDYYGPSYLQDLSLATRYSAAHAIGKAARYRYTAEAFHKEGEGREYHVVEALPLRCAMVMGGRLDGWALARWAESIVSGEIRAEGCLSVDEFNYCQDSAAEICPLVDDLALADTGMTLAELEGAADRIQPDRQAFSARKLAGKELFSLFGPAVREGVDLRVDGDQLYISAELVGHTNIYARHLFAPADLGFGQEAKLYLDITPGLDVRLALIFLDEDRRKLEVLHVLGNRNHRTALPEGTRWVQMALRVAGSGNCAINGLMLGNISVTTGALLGRSDVLVISNHYPRYDDLYRYAFLHRRVVAYRKAGRMVDVFRFSATQAGGYYEFSGIDVISGHQDELHRALSSGRYRKLFVHFLDPPMWEVISQYLDQIQVFVWLHGSEVQPWQRRDYDLTDEEQKRRAVAASDQRMAFWRQVFGSASSQLHFVFVSRYFAEEVMGDVGVRLPPTAYHIIPNCIDTDLFAYHAKSPELRRKVLSIRPFASRKYANDLTVKAILELAKEPFFRDLVFCLIGDGRLFEETISPVRDLPNVILERGFLRQEEIAALHREYGVFLSPTRMDAQGVSRDEAMSSGLVPVTNRVAAVPEFVDGECGMLVEEEDHLGLARAIATLYHDPDLFLRLSRNAAERVRGQSGPEQTIARELEFMR